MKLSTGTRSRLIGLADQLSGVGLKLGVPIFAVAAAYLLYAAFGSHIREMAKMSESERAYFVDSVRLALVAMRLAGVVVIGSLLLRFFPDELLGQVLALVGAAACFGLPYLLAASLPGAGVKGNEVIASIVSEFRATGWLSLLPGLVLILRDAILRIWTGISIKRIEERRWGDEEERRAKHRKPRIYGSCWHMPFCREFVRRVCPAYRQRKTCWRIKVGCYCDERTILTAMTSSGEGSARVERILRTLGLDQPAATKLSGKVKRERCRRCGIYGEHQRQKYRIASPLVFPAVAGLLYAFYGSISAWLWFVIEKTDRFMSFLTYRPIGAEPLGAGKELLVTLAVIWVAIVAVSYALRVIEYLVFELQV